jgi:hypothetical protein
MSGRSRVLVIAVIALSLVVFGTTVLRLNELFPWQLASVIAWAGFGLNVALAAVGAWLTPHRAAWIAYLAASIAGMILIGGSTAINALILFVWLFV